MSIQSSAPIVQLRDASEGYGGKAAGLAALIACGLPVPRGIALSPEFVRRLALDFADADIERVLSTVGKLGYGDTVAVRSSAMNEDGEANSFAGIYDTVLNVRVDGIKLGSAIKKVSGCEGSARASAYSSARQVAPTDIPQLGIVIQEMVSPVIAGVAFSTALAANGTSVMLFECVEGLGDRLVSGEVQPTRIEVPMASDGSPDVARSIMVGSPLDMTCLFELAKLIKKASNGLGMELDIEWAVDASGKAWMLQARPLTRAVLVPAVASGRSVPASPGMVKGSTFVVDSKTDLEVFPDGAVFVAEVTETDYLPAMRRAAGIITEEGGILSHAAIVARELGIPCMVGYTGARSLFPTGTMVTIDGTSGAVTNHSDPQRTVHCLGKYDVDWGAAYLFDNVVAMRVGSEIGLFDPTPNGLVLHIAPDVSAEADSEFEVFARKHFGQSPKRYQSDKYLWYFEWIRFQSIGAFRRSLDSSKQIISTLDSALLRQHYESVITSGAALAASRDGYPDPASKFLVDEALLSTHFLLTMLIPEGYGLRYLYSEAIPQLGRTGLSFAALLSGDVSASERCPQLTKVLNYSKTLSVLRNEVYGRLLESGIMRDNYFEDRDARAANALHSMSIDLTADEEPVTRFYRGLHGVARVGPIADLLRP